MKDILTKEQRETVERAKALLADKWNYGVGEWVGVAEILMGIIDNLSKRGVKKYSEEELRAEFSKSFSWHVDPDELYKEKESAWLECARFLGSLEEK
jgi:hypothetical protein